MSSVKIALRAAKSAIDACKYEDAIAEAHNALSADPNNYHAKVFLGLALDKLNQNEASEEAYRAAINIRGQDALAWQGLVALYEKETSEKLDDYHHAALRLAEIHMANDDRTKCQAVIDKYIGDARKYGSRSQLKHSLEALLPGSSIYNYLEGRIQQPAYTYIKIADIVEAEEREKTNSEIGQRRTRLGARINQVTAEVNREVLENSPLEELYSNVINWTQDDDVRRQYEEKLLQHATDTLAALPMPRKAAKREAVMKMAEGLVILKHPFLLAWNIVMEWKDVEEIKDLDAGLLKEFVGFFPDEGLSKVLKGYLDSEITPFPGFAAAQKDGVKDEEGNPLFTIEDRLIIMIEGIEDASKSILAHRLVGEYYLYLDEYERAVSTARAGIKCIVADSNNWGLNLAHSCDAMNTILATALTYYQAPRHHAEARSLFEQVLRGKPADTPALIGLGMIYEEEEDYESAIDSLNRALKKSRDPIIKAEAAWCKALNGDNEAALRELEACLPELEDQGIKTKSLRSQTLYRIGMCLWSLDTNRGARKDRNGAYARFLASLQADMNFAPAYTSLGIYYADYARDKKRARKCFQKAFELSSSEVEAAHRLADSFALSGQWDLVEVVAQRVVESGKIRPAPGSKKEAISWPYAALGVVQLNNQDYAKSAVSFQSALRLAPRNFHCWVGLGESYHNSGRYIAATKAFEHAQQVEDAADSEGLWFVEYMLANVKRELGEYDDAVPRYRKGLKSKPDEYGVSIALLQTLVEVAWRNVELGFFGRAVDSAKEAIGVAQQIVRIRDDAFNLWKAIGDASSIFSAVQCYEGTLPREQLQCLLEDGVDLSVFEILADIDGINWDSFRLITDNSDQGLGGTPLSMIVSILAQKRAVHSSAKDPHARAVAWYNLGWAEHRAYAYCAETLYSSPRREPLRHVKAAVQCFKRSIELEAGNGEFWNSLGIVASNFSPKVAQHAFVRSLYLNDKNARVWTNLGALALRQSDTDLAHEAFTRAQSADPDYAEAWLGQGFLAARKADVVEARHLFAHAFEISDASNTLIKQQYANATFDHVASAFQAANTGDLLQPLLALHQVRRQLPSDIASHQLLSLFDERVGNFDEAVSMQELVGSTLETEYETAESLLALTRFAQARADLGRVQLAKKEFTLAAENAETALDLSTDEAGGRMSCRTVRLSAHMTAGLAYYYQGLMDQSIEMFKAALSETQGNPDIICLLAQVLWAKGGDNEREVAREQLLDCIERYPRHVAATILLGSVAVLDDDQDTLQAVTTDLEGLRTNDDLSVQEEGRIAQLLTSIASLHPTHESRDVSELSRATSIIMLGPSQPHGWNQLASVSGDNFPAEIAVLTAVKAVPPRGNLEAEDLCRAYARSGKLDDAQRAAMIAPFKTPGWEALGEWFRDD
ncbi:MAG: hypothetical protein Q9163_004838 [Psora crenata]